MPVVRNRGGRGRGCGRGRGSGRGRPRNVVLPDDFVSSDSERGDLSSGEEDAINNGDDPR